MPQSRSSALLESFPWRSSTSFVTAWRKASRSEEHTSELQSRFDIVCRLLLEKKKRSVLTVNDEQARTVRRIYHEYLEGIGPNRIAAALDADGVPTPGDVQATRRVNNDGWLDT